MAKRGLGRGLGSLIPGLSQNKKLQFEEVLVSQIEPNPNQPRKHYDQAAFGELVSSISSHGLVQPVVVKRKGIGFELIAGERRWRAAKEAGLKTIPAIVRSSDTIESLKIALIENIQRQDLNPLEQARGYQQLMTLSNLTQTELADKLGKSRTAVTNILRLLQLPPSIQKLVQESQISFGHARALLGVEDKNKQLALANQVVSKALSVRETERLVKLSKITAPPARRPIPNPFKQIARQLCQALDTKVKVKAAKLKGKGKLEIEFNSEEQLKELAKRLLAK